MSRELHVALLGISSVSAETIVPSLEVAVYRSDGSAIRDMITPSIALKSGGLYLPPSAINAAFVAAAKSHLADADGWNVPASYDAEYLHSGVSVAAAVQAIKKTADSSFTTSTATDVPAGASGSPAMAFALAAGRIYRFSFESLVRSNTVLDGVGMSISTPVATVFSATGRFAGAGLDGSSCEWVGNITSSDDPVLTASVVASNTDYRFIIEGTILPSASGVVTLRARTNAGIGTMTVRQGSTGMLWDLGL